MSNQIKKKGNTTKPGNPLWDEYVEVDEYGNEVGPSTLTIINPKRVSTFDQCDHHYIYTDGGSSAVCKYCNLGCRIILGIHQIKDGKILTRL